MRILEGRRRQVEERREGLREAVARASNSLDRYTRQLHQLGLESSEREVKWLNELIAAEVLEPGIGIIQFEELEISSVRARRRFPHDF